MNKKILITLAAIFILMPGIANASELKVKSLSFRWYVNGTLNHYDVLSPTSFGSSNMTFTGAIRTNSTSRVWPYTEVRYYIEQPTFSLSKTYDLDFIAFTALSDGKSISAKVNNTTYCQLVSTANYLSYFHCTNLNLVNSTGNYIQITFTNTGGSTASASYGLSKLNFVESSESNTDDILSYMSILEDTIKNQNQSIIDNANKNHQEQIENENKNHQETMDTITDPDTNDANSSASSFFDSFKDTDNGGLSSIVTAPLRLINEMLSIDGYGKPICAKWLNSKLICLPSGDWLWFGKSKELINLINMLEVGLLSYWILIDLYKTIERIKNPEEDKVEVMNL